MAKKPRDRYRLMTCGGCGRKVDRRSYQGNALPDTSAERITKLYDPNAPSYSISCTCGHYTTYTHSEEEAREFPDRTRPSVPTR